MPPLSSPTAPFRFRRSLRRPGLIALEAGCLAALFASLLPNYYRSEARILSDTGHAGSTASLRAGVWAPSAPPETTGSREEGPTIIYADILRSRRLAEALLQGRYEYTLRSWRFGKPRRMAGTLQAYLGASSLDQGAGALRRLLAVQRDLKSGMITISVESKAPSLSLEVVQRAIRALGEIVVELSRMAAVNKVRFTQARLEEVKVRYGDLGRAFQRFQDANRSWETSPAPNIRFQGNQLKEELDLWKQVVTNLTLNHEQALLEAQNDTQTLLLLDPGNLPVEKSRPARSLLVFAVMVTAGIGSWGWIHRAAIYRHLISKEVQK